ncbi:hypothetical protein BDV18DRAFT_41479 [Aspergillus unguis]
MMILIGSVHSHAIAILLISIEFIMIKVVPLDLRLISSILFGPWSEPPLLSDHLLTRELYRDAMYYI